MYVCEIVTRSNSRYLITEDSTGAVTRGFVSKVATDPYTPPECTPVQVGEQFDFVSRSEIAEGEQVFFYDGRGHCVLRTSPVVNIDDAAVVLA